MNTNHSPEVSIVVTSYNNGRFLVATIESIIQQTHTDWELILIEDASNDDSLVIAQKYTEQEPRIRLIIHEKNKGLAFSVREGVFAARGKQVAFLESDDTWEPRSLEQKLHWLKKSGAALCWSDFNAIGAPNFWRRRGLSMLLANDFARLEPYRQISLPWLPVRNIIPSFSCVMAQADVLRSLNFNTPEQNGELTDHWLWSQIAATQTFCFIPEKLTNWNLHPASYMVRQSRGSIATYREKKREYVQQLLALVVPLTGSTVSAEKYLTECLAQRPGKNGLVRQMCDAIEARRLRSSIFWKTLVYSKDFLWLTATKSVLF